MVAINRDVNLPPLSDFKDGIGLPRMKMDFCERPEPSLYLSSGMSVAANPFCCAVKECGSTPLGAGGTNCAAKYGTVSPSSNPAVDGNHRDCAGLRHPV